MVAGNWIFMAASYYYLQETRLDLNADTMYHFDVQYMQWKDPVFLLIRDPHHNC